MLTFTSRFIYKYVLGGLFTVVSLGIILICLSNFYTLSSQAQDFCTVEQITNTPAGALNQLPTISGDGTLITFNSNFNLTGMNADGSLEVFLFDTETNTFTQITNGPAGTFSSAPIISTNGNRISLNSDANLTGGNDGNRELFYFDLNTNMFTQVTSAPNVVSGDNCEAHDINANGTRISFACAQDINMTNPDNNLEMYLFDTVSTIFTQITDTTFPVGNLGNSINAVGTLVAFDSNGNLTGMNADGSREIFLFDSFADTITQITSSPNVPTIDSSNPSINGPGNRIAFQSRTDLTGQNPDNNREVFFFDSDTNLITQVTSSIGSDNDSFGASIDAQGSLIAFATEDDINGGNPEGNDEIYLFDTNTNTFTQITQSMSGDSNSPDINAAGNKIVFDSRADLTGQNPDGSLEIFLTDCRGRDLSITKVDFPDPVVVNQTLNYTLFVVNFGPTAATGVTVTDNLPPEVMFGSVATTQGMCIEAGGTINCDIGDMALGDVVRIDIQVTPTIIGAILNVASVTSNGIEDNPDNNMVAEPTMVIDGPPPTTNTDLFVIKDGIPSPVEVDTNLTYSVFMANFGPDPATGVTLTDLLPVSANFVSATPTQGLCNEVGSIVTCDIGDMAVGQTVQVDIVVTPTVTGLIVNIAQVFSNENDLTPANNITGDITQVVDSQVPTETANLLITKDGFPDPVLVNENLTYNIFVVNFGPNNATGVTITDTLPGSVNFVSAMPTQGTCMESGGQVTCDLGDLALGATAQVEIIVTPTVLGTILNFAQALADQPDPVLGNNVVADITQVVDDVPPVPTADLLLIKTDFPDPVTLNENLTYTLFAINSGPEDTTGVVLTDTLSSSVIFVSATPTQGACLEVVGVVTCDLGDLSAGSNAKIVIIVTPTTPGTILNFAELDSDLSDPDPLNNRAVETTTIVEAPMDIDIADLSIIKSDSPDPVTEGATLTYQLVVTNSGPDQANDIIVRDTLPDSVNFVSATSNQGVCNEFAGIVECFLGSLPSGSFTQIEIIVEPTVTGAIVNIAQVEGSEFDPLSSNNISTQTTTVRIRSINPPDPPDPPDPGDKEGADLFVLKFGSPNPIVVGQNLNYSVFIGNLGTLDATNVVLTDVLPSSTQFISATPSQGTCFEFNGIVTCELGDIVDGGIELAVVVEILVRTNATGIISNIAQVIGNENDNNTSNNIQIAMVEVVGTGNPTLPPTDPGDDNNSSSSSCAIAGESSMGNLTANLSILLLPLIVFGIRAVKRKK